jgi:hypothetical protein
MVSNVGSDELNTNLRLLVLGRCGRVAIITTLLRLLSSLLILIRQSLLVFCNRPFRIKLPISSKDTLAFSWARPSSRSRHYRARSGEENDASQKTEDRGLLYARRLLQPAYPF